LTKPTRNTKAPQRRNQPAGMRRKAILDAAVDLFAEKGDAMTVQVLADRIGVTQPLIHHYFPNKATLIDQVLVALMDSHWDNVPTKILQDKSQPLRRRIAEFYKSYLPLIYKPSWHSGFWFASASNPEFSRTYISKLTTRIFVPIASEARALFGYPTSEEQDISAREINLVRSIHTSFVFIGFPEPVTYETIQAEIEENLFDQIDGYLGNLPRVLAEVMPGQQRAPEITDQPR